MADTGGTRPSSGGSERGRAPTPEGRPAGPAPADDAPTSGSTEAPATSAPPPGVATEPPMQLQEARSAITSNAPGVADIADALARSVVGSRKTATQFNDEFVVPGNLTRKAIEAYVTDPAAGSNKERAQRLGSKDTIAVQKFADIDGEQHLEDASLKTSYYDELIGKMRAPSYVDRTHTFETMKAARPYSYCFRGTPIPAGRLAPHSTRNQSVKTLFDANVIPGEIGARIATELQTKGVRSGAEIARQQANRDMHRKAYRHILAEGRDVQSTIDSTGNITNYGTWYHPGEIANAQFAGSTESAYGRMMRMGALQPEWYPDGTVVLSIDTSLGRRTRDVRKPTCFDGLLSALWTSRNVGESDYGLTGGGAAEFLESNVPWSEVSSARAVIPGDDFLADIQRVATQVANAFESPAQVQARRDGSASVTDSAFSPTAELARGNRRDTSILNTTSGRSGVGGMYGDLVSDTTREHNTPGASPSVPGAASPSAPAAAAPRGPAAASGGAFDTRGGPRAGAMPTSNPATDPRR